MAVKFELFLIRCPVCGENTARVGIGKGGIGRTFRTICPCGASLQAGRSTRAGKSIAHQIAHARPRTPIAPRPVSTSGGSRVTLP